MNTSSSQRDSLIESLKHYQIMLRERNEALEQLSDTSKEMQTILENEEYPDITSILERRSSNCKTIANMSNTSTPNNTILKIAKQLANNASDELGKLANVIISMSEDANALSKEILRCQQKCEKILKQRLESTAHAIRQSTCRQKLDMAYGPAIRHDIPMFLDKQQ